MPEPSQLNEPGFNPFRDLVGFRFIECENGRCVCELEIDPKKHFHPGGIVHGGVAYTLADSSMALATMSTLDGSQACSTIEIKISYLAPVRDGRMTAESTILKRGKRIAFLETRVHQGDKLIATATGTFAIIEV